MEVPVALEASVERMRPGISAVNSSPCASRLPDICLELAL